MPNMISITYVDVVSGANETFQVAEGTSVTTLLTLKGSSATTALVNSIAVSGDTVLEDSDRVTVGVPTKLEVA